MFYYQSSRKRKNEFLEVQPYWLSIGDLMAGVLIIFILFFVLKINSEVKLRRTFEDLFMMKQKIISQLKGIFERNGRIKVLDDGTVRFFIDDPDNQWFKPGESELQPVGQQELLAFTQKYLTILFSPDNQPYVDKIVVEGHTDSRGKKAMKTENERYLYNLQLSQQRAYSVAAFIHERIVLSEDPSTQKRYESLLRKKVTASGRSYIDVIRDDSGEENKLYSRRVEFKFQLPMEEKYRQFKANN